MNRPRPLFLRTAALAALSGGLLSCDSSPTGPVVASVQVTASDEDVRVGGTLQLTATPQDQNGSPVPGQTITWSSSDSDLATVSTSGLVTGITEGQVTITAEASQITGQITLQVVNPPEITSISPAVLRPGEEMVITGERFSSSAGNNQVRVHGALATVLEASPTSLRARVAEFTCGPEGSAPVVVTAGGDSTDPFQHPFEPDQVVSLEAGEFVHLASPSARCLVLGPSLTGATYLVGVQSTSGVISQRTPVRIRGIQGQSSASTASMSPNAENLNLQRSPTSAARTGVASRTDLLLGPDADPHALRWRNHRIQEGRIRAAERRDVEPVIRRGFHRTAASGELVGASTAAQTVPVGVQAGDTIDVKVPDINGSICNDFTTATTVVRRVGVRSVWLEDVANPEDGLTAQDYETLALEFDDVIYEEVVSFFDEPTDLDENERIVIVITRRLNEMNANVLGFVVSSDFFAGDGGCASANGGEFYYARAPDAEGSISDPEGNSREYARERALSDAPLLLAHEVTHIIQFGRRLIINGVPSLEQAWVMEGQATLAEEVVGFRYTGHQPGSNLNNEVAFDALHPPTGVPWFSNAFLDMAVYYGVDRVGDDFVKLDEAPHSCGWLDLQNPEPCISRRIGYGVTWSLLRWLSDHLTPDDRAFQRAIVNSTTTGFETLSQAIGTNVRPLLGPWAAAHFTDGRIPGGDPLLDFPSWNLRDIEQRVVPEARLAPEERTFTDVQRDLVVAAGSTTYQIFRAELSHPAYAVSALTQNDQELSSNMQLWVVRLP